MWNGRLGRGLAGRRRRGTILAGLALGAAVAACDDGIAPRPPKHANLAPETYLQIQSDRTSPQFYTVALRWLGSDPDGRVAGYRVQWTCLDPGAGRPCPQTPPLLETTDQNATFTLQVPVDSVRYRVQVATVDDEGLADPSPGQQDFTLVNQAPVLGFEANSLRTSSLPAITFYFTAADPDSTADPSDRDSRTDLLAYRGWLEGNEAAARVVPVGGNSLTFFPEDFQGQSGPRTAWFQVLDDGGAASAPVSHTWNVVEPPVDGILLVDDCRMGGALEGFSDQTYRGVLESEAADRLVVLDIETIPRLGQADLEASLSLFDRVVWYTDSDTRSSGALELSRVALESLLERSGRFLLCSGFAFGTGAAFGPQEARFRDLFGIDSVFVGPGGVTDFAISQTDSVQAAVTPGLQQLRFISLGLGSIMDCFASRPDGTTSSLYFYPESTFVRGDSLEYVNAVQHDIGVQHRLADGGRTVYLSFPIGVPINTNAGENETELRALLRLAGVLEP
jgi:hypothetical protein